MKLTRRVLTWAGGITRISASPSVIEKRKSKNPTVSLPATRITAALGNSNAGGVTCDFSVRSETLSRYSKWSGSTIDSEDTMEFSPRFRLDGRVLWCLDDVRVTR